MNLTKQYEPYWGTAKTIQKLAQIPLNQKKKIVFIYSITEENVAKLCNPNHDLTVVLFTFY